MVIRCLRQQFKYISCLCLTTVPYHKEGHCPWGGRGWGRIRKCNFYVESCESVKMHEDKQYNSVALENSAWMKKREKMDCTSNWKQLCCNYLSQKNTNSFQHTYNMSSDSDKLM